jgi:hypothetical protein
MKSFIAVALILSSVTSFANDWSQPPVMCPEEFFPQSATCPDFSGVADPLKDYPAPFTTADIDHWKSRKSADLRYCRHQEVLRRAGVNPEAYGPNQKEISWMMVNGSMQGKEKTAAIYEASQKYDMPPQILMGALRQESLLSSIGISADGNNYSCGIAQLNIQEWCHAMSEKSDAEKDQMGWPRQIDCSASQLPTTVVKPFYDIAIQRLNGRPLFTNEPKDYEGIQFAEVAREFPNGSAELQQTRFQAAQSFIRNCQQIKLSILAKAKVLRNLFDTYVPAYLKNGHKYSAGQKFNKSCQQPYRSSYYPLHTGWLMAVAMYNAGPAQSKLVEHYFEIKEGESPVLTPADLVEALHWGGKVRWFFGEVAFKGINGGSYTQTWFKSCIVQRHVARVVQHVTSPGAFILKSLEEAPCTPSGVPDYRKKAPGKKASPAAR